MNQSFPITPYLEEICSSLKNSPEHFLILTAETAAGKSTLLPLALLKNFPKKIIMLEPRRLAVLAIANRVSELLGENTGETCGYRIQLDSCISNKTRFEIITEAILTKKLQEDPSLEDVSVVVIDEFHERSIHADLALAFLKESMQLRDDLYVLIMSATIDTKELAEYAGSRDKPAPVFHVPGRQFPVSIEYAGNITPAKAIQKELSKPIPQKQSISDSSILVFLPGISDIQKCKSQLEEQNIDAEILILHSSIPFAEQKKVLEPADNKSRRRVILSSAIAETSLTIPGVTTVIDSGFSRVNQFIISAGMEKLVTERISFFSAEQRAGRAGRTAPGKCIRLWNEFDILAKKTEPEILRTDLTSLVLECITWGISTPENLDWLNRPNINAWNAAVNLLNMLGCIKIHPRISITEIGKAVLKIGLSPRLACTALFSTQIALENSQYKDSSPYIQKKFLAALNRKISTLKPLVSNLSEKNLSLSTTTAALLAGFPDRLAKKTQTENTYQFPSGRIAAFESNSAKPVDNLWIVATEVKANEKSGIIYSWKFIPQKEVDFWLSQNERTVTQTVTEFTENRTLRKTEYKLYGKIVLSEKKLPASDSEDFAEAVCNSVISKGFSWLPLNQEIENFLIRVQFYKKHISTGPALPAVENLAENVKSWLLPFLSGKSKIDSQTVYEALRWHFSAEEIDKAVPLQITLPNGKKAKIKYEQNQTDILPVIEIIIQQIFGCFETPKILGVPVLLKLLSPARRPLQITNSLENFWQNSWPEICKEMKGRYPKHNWEYRKPVLEK